MKRLLLSIAVLLPCLLAHSQEAESLGNNNYAELSVISRLDANPTFSSAEKFNFNFGNSSIYTLFEGSFSEHLSWTVANHWISESDDILELYKNLGRSDGNNWVDLAYLDLSLGSWTFSLGKQMIATGGFEYSDWDWDVHTAFATPLWDGLACYQWGGSVAWSTPSELSSLTLQMTASPYGEHPFGSGLWTYSAQWAGEYGWFSNLWSISALETSKGQYSFLAALGQKFAFSDRVSLIVDWTNNRGFAEEDWSLLRGSTFQGLLCYAPSDRFDITLRGWYIPSASGDAGPDWTVGGVFQYYPLASSQDLILHSYLAYNSMLSQTTLSIGARFNLGIKIF